MQMVVERAKMDREKKKALATVFINFMNGQRFPIRARQFNRTSIQEAALLLITFFDRGLPIILYVPVLLFETGTERQPDRRFLEQTAGKLSFQNTDFPVHVFAVLLQ